MNFNRKIFEEKIFSLTSEDEFLEAALELFHFQSAGNRIYKQYLDILGFDPGKVKNLADIIFLPVSFFKTRRIITGSSNEKIVFRSSGTAGDQPSRHYVPDPGIYEKSFLKCFEIFYGSPSKYCILALLPSYLERGDSSLVYMAGKLIEKSSCPDSGFYLDNTEKLASTIIDLEAGNVPVILLGVSFALLDLVEQYNFSLKSTVIIETGGMKGKRKELTREELHQVLKSRTGLKFIHSEYGMTELFSQAWSASDGIFSTPPWMKVMVRDSYDPFSYVPAGRSGGINVIDLANIDSCAFLETSDLGRILPDGRFEVLGRFDNSEIRGCNLLAE
jgi:phenylacetate-coenzyme A ligase PaaK-like adenylate-forming protein